MTIPFPLEPSPAELDVWTQRATAFVREHITTLGAIPSADLIGGTELAATFDEPMPEEGSPIEAILARLDPAVKKSFNTAGPGYLAFIPGGGLPSAAIADYIALSTNRYVGVSMVSPALVAIEAAAIRWLARAMGYDDGRARGILTSGGSLSNLSAIVTARARLLPEDAIAKGTMYVSTETHLSVKKAAIIAGIPRANVRVLPSDARQKLDPSMVKDAISKDRDKGLLPFLIVASAGTTNTGAIDPLHALCDLGEAERVSVHADAAYGGFFQLTPEGKQKLAGIERCDSITLDPHKGLFLPYGTGLLLVKDGEALRRAHSAGLDADYLRDVSAGENFTDYSPELSREHRGLRLWLPLVLHGARAFREALDEKLALTRRAYERLAKNPRFSVIGEPELSIVAFQIEGATNDQSLDVLRRVNGRGRVYLSSTMIRGKVTLRICVLSFRTHEDRVDDALDALDEEVARLG